jgi:hypothetical protein
MGGFSFSVYASFFKGHLKNQQQGGMKKGESSKYKKREKYDIRRNKRAVENPAD